MYSVRRQLLVVGVSGSRASAAALRWAAAEALRRHARLRVVRTWDPEFDAPYAPSGQRPGPHEQRESAGASLASQLRATFGRQMPAWVTAELARGVAERVLVDRSAGADLLVLGSAAPPSPTARSVGPVVRACLSRSQCPVVVCAADQPTIRPAAPVSGRVRYPRPARTRPVPAQRSRV